MSVNIGDTIKNTLVTLFDGESLGATISDPKQHPMVEFVPFYGWYGVYALIAGVASIPAGLVGWIPILG
jgi:hypothetical protein